MPDSEPDPAARRALADHLSRLRHDLGRYVGLQVAWLGPEPAPEALREALAADLLATRRGPSGTVDAGTVWRELRPGLVGDAPLDHGGTVDLRGDPDLERLDAAMREVVAVAEALRADRADEAALRRGADAARAAAEACRALWTRHRG